MTDFLLELRSEEIPARMQDKAREDLARLFVSELAKAGLPAPAIETYATPRRLVLIARGLAETSAASSEEVKGPRASAPPQALEGFLRKTGLTADQLVERDGVLFALIERPGRATADLLAEAIPAIVRAFPWPKSMRWGEASASTASLRWVRPLQGIVALFGDEVVPFAIEGIESGAATLGHRFHHPGPITIGNADDYLAKLEACHVIVDQDRRRAIIRERGAALAAEAGLRVIEDEGLVAENAGLTEWPVPLLGAFDPDFLEVPREVIQLTMRTNQKYFALTDGAGQLAPYFLCTANIEALDGGAGIVAGNRKVLAARLSDARFFWEQDKKVPLDEQRQKLDRIVFHEKLGTVADKVARVAKLARWLVEEGIVKSSPHRGEGDHAQHGGGGSLAGAALLESPLHQPTAGPPPRAGEDRVRLAAMAEQAARLCKADLVTGMVGEFPELQGVMGGYYARAEGYPDEVADAIRDHYKPVGQGDEVPTAPVTVAVSLADKLDTLVAFFAADMPPTGSKDPFALRRAMLGEQALTEANGLRFSLSDVALKLVNLLAPKEETGRRWIWGEQELQADQIDSDVRWSPQTLVDEHKTIGALGTFFADRLKVQQREAGVRHDLIDAVFALGGEDDLVRLLARVKALQALVETEDGANLLAGYKRAANILKKEGWDASAPLAEGLTNSNQIGYSPLPEEEGLMAVLADVESEADTAITSEDFAGAMRALAALRAPVDRFFEKVTVNDPDPAKRAARLALLARVRDAVHRVADFSRIEG